MTEHRPIKPPHGDDADRNDADRDRSSLLERASGAFGLSNLGAAPMPTSFDDVPMKRARPLRKPAANNQDEPSLRPVPDVDSDHRPSRKSYSSGVSGGMP